METCNTALFCLNPAISKVWPPISWKICILARYWLNIIDVSCQDLSNEVLFYLFTTITDLTTKCGKRSKSAFEKLKSATRRQMFQNFKYDFMIQHAPVQQKNTEARWFQNILLFRPGLLGTLLPSRPRRGEAILESGWSLGWHRPCSRGFRGQRQQQLLRRWMRPRFIYVPRVRSIHILVHLFHHC